MTISRRFWLSLLGTLLITGLSVGVMAQTSEGEPILHEYFNPWEVDLSSESGGESGATAEEGEAEEGDDTAGSPTREPGSMEGQPPALSVDPGRDEAILGSGGPVDRGVASEPYGPLSPGEGVSRLDDRTDRVDNLGYYANFEPSVVPYKRTVVQDTVAHTSNGYDFSLSQTDSQAVSVEGGSAASDEEVFWGSFLLRAEAGKRHPIPSVAPDQRILEVRTEPNT
ncbi:MAG: hypothetical protein ACOCV2_15835, partial [Persicimonas sp.]